jgi:L-fuconolactonase
MPRPMIPRRTFLGTSMSVAATAATLNARALSVDQSDDLEIIDCHTHFYDPSRPEGVPWPSPGSSLYRTVLPQHLRELKQYRRITGTVIVEASPLVEDNAWLLDLAKDDPFIVGIVGNLMPGKDEFAGHLDRFARNPLFRGIRVSSKTVTDLLSSSSLDDLKKMIDHDLSLDVNGGPDTPGIVAKLAGKLPTLRIVQNHIGNVRITADPPPVDWKAGIEAAAKHANVFCKISALVEGASRDGRKAPAEMSFYKPYIDVVWNAFGEDRVIYGSNWPVSENAADYETLQRIVMEYAAERSEEATAKFCSKNAARAYKWISPKA